MTKKASTPPCPPIPADLLEYMNRLYPERCPSPTAEERQIWIAVGRREVVRWMLSEYAAQREKPTTDK